MGQESALWHSAHCPHTISFRLEEGSALEFQTIVHLVPSPGVAFLSCLTDIRLESHSMKSVSSGNHLSTWKIATSRSIGLRGSGKSNRSDLKTWDSMFATHSETLVAFKFLDATGMARESRLSRLTSFDRSTLSRSIGLLFTNTGGFFMKSWIRLTTNRFKFSSSHLVG